MTLIISKAKEVDSIDGVIPQIRDLIGPKDVNLAKEQAPTRCVTWANHTYSSFSVGGEWGEVG